MLTFLAILAILALGFLPMAAPGATKKARKKKVARTAGQRLAGIANIIQSFGWSLIRKQMKADPTLQASQAGILRARHDSKMFSFYSDPAKVTGRIEKLKDRIAKTEKMASLVQTGEVKRDALVDEATSAFKAVETAVFDDARANMTTEGYEPNVKGIFDANFPADLRSRLAKYNAETPDLFAGTEDESEDTEEDELAQEDADDTEDATDTE